MEFTMTLREALQEAVALKDLSEEAQMLIMALLDQSSEKYGTLVDECQVAIFG
jgi:hypothetical protein